MFWFLLPTVDDGNPVAQQVGLVHEVSGEDDGPPGLVLDQELPYGSPGVGVDPGSGLVQHNHSKHPRPGELEHNTTLPLLTLSLRQKRRQC